MTERLDSELRGRLRKEETVALEIVDAWLKDLPDGVDPAQLQEAVDAQFAAYLAANPGLVTPLATVAAATTGNITLSGIQTIDTVATPSAVFVGKQSAGATFTDPVTGLTNSPFNGIYVPATGAWVRRSDNDAAGEFYGRTVFVTGGTANAGKTYGCKSVVTTVGTSAVSWVLVKDEAGEAAARISGDDANTASINAIRSSIEVGVPGTPVTGTSSSNKTYIYTNPMTQDVAISSIRAFATSATTLQVKRFSKEGDVFTQVGSDVPVALAAGLNVIDVSALNISVLSGERIGWYAGTNINYVDGSGYSGGYYEGVSGNQSTFTDTAPTTTVNLQIGFTAVGGIIRTLDARIADNEATVATHDARLTTAENAVTDLVSNQDLGVTGTPVTGTATGNKVFLYADTVAADSVITQLRVFAVAATTVFIKRFNKSGDVFTQVGADVPVAVASGANTIDLTGLSVTCLAGERIGWYAGANVTFLSGTGFSGGYYEGVSGNQSTFTDASLATTVKLQIGFTLASGAVKTNAARISVLEGKVNVDTFDAAPYLDEILSATTSISGLVASVTANFYRNGSATALADTKTLTATTDGSVRFDVHYYDPLNGAWGVVQGTERVNDPTAFIPTLPDLSFIPVYQYRVAGSTVTALPLYNLRNGECREITTLMERNRRQARQLIRKTRAKIIRKESLRILGFGDSITCVGLNGASTSVNGTGRDTKDYLDDMYGADVFGPIPTFTAVALGRADDGAGAIHTRVGWNWQLVSAIEQTGYTLATNLFYDNYGIPGADSADAVIGGSPTAWLTNAAAVSADLVVIALGMNERGATTTEANLMVIANTFKAAGRDVIFLDCPRPRGLEGVSAWEYTNRAIRRAAVKTGSAHVAFAPLADAKYIQALGLPVSDVCAANNSNHPGFTEFRAYGGELAKVVVDG